jgi:cation diffusion facilitator CzcD-associated flavoprotein CzcO
VTRSYDAIVVGGGPAGLAASRALTRAGLEHCVLERGGRAGHTWVNLYDSLVLHTGKHLSALPGMPFPRGTALFPTRQQFVDYLHTYAETFHVPLQPGATVVSADRHGERWRVRLDTHEELQAHALVVATGIVANPHTPDVRGRSLFAGPLAHSVAYRRPHGAPGRRVLILGAGNSAGEIAVELARSGARVTLAVRSGATIVPRSLLGVPIQYWSVLLSPLPRTMVERVTTSLGLLRGPRILPPPRAARCSKVPLIGLALADALRSGSIQLRGDVQAFTADGARFADGGEDVFDEVILATGYRAALGFLDGLIRIDSCGFASRRDRVTSADQAGLYFVGQNYDARGGLYNIAIDAPLAARAAMGALRAASQRSTGTPPARSER